MHGQRRPPVAPLATGVRADPASHGHWESMAADHGLAGRVVAHGARRGGAVASRRRPVRRQRIFTAPGPRWFPADAAIRTVHGDAAMFVGGLRALVLQALHPLAMAGVAGHSGYRGDPWGRLQRTSRFLAATTFGPADVAERTVARVRAVHRTVRGTAPDGRPYRADDPHLLRWVHVAEVDSFLRAHRRFGDHRPDRAAGSTSTSPRSASCRRSSA